MLGVCLVFAGLGGTVSTWLYSAAKIPAQNRRNSATPTEIQVHQHSRSKSDAQAGPAHSVHLGEHTAVDMSYLLHQDISVFTFAAMVFRNSADMSV